jgi:hypothetical protein
MTTPLTPSERQLVLLEVCYMLGMIRERQTPYPDLWRIVYRDRRVESGRWAAWAGTPNAVKEENLSGTNR